MAKNVFVSFEGDPYVWDTNQDPLAESVTTLWNDVANKLETSQEGKSDVADRRRDDLSFERFGFQK